MIEKLFGISKPIIDDPLLYDEGRCRRIIQSMSAGGWFNPPLSPLDICKTFELFNGKRDDKLRELYTVLISRASAREGVCKIYNKTLASVLGISERQVITLINKLLDASVIGVLKDYYPKGAEGPRQIRIFIVWPAFYMTRCQVTGPAWTRMKSTNRAGIEEFKRAIGPIPFRFKIKRPTTIPVNGVDTLVYPERVDLDYLLFHGIIDQWMFDKILFYTELPGEGYREAVFDVMGSPVYKKRRKPKKPE